MAASSTMLPLGTALPSFSLTNTVTGLAVRSEDFAGKPVLVMFICNHCPYVVHVRKELGRLAGDYAPKGVAIVAINSNSLKSHPEDGPEEMKKLAKSEGWAFPFLFDSSQQIARAFQAACTPEFYLFDSSHKLVYRGQLDDSRPGKDVPVTGKDLRAALDAMLGSRPISTEQRPSVGCGIKWE
jgi:peroxiredoxin